MKSIAEVWRSFHADDLELGSPLEMCSYLVRPRRLVSPRKPSRTNHISPRRMCIRG